MLSAETHRGNREASGEESYGRFLYNRFRYYAPGIGRYISADPIGQFGVLGASGVEVAGVAQSVGVAISPGILPIRTGPHLYVHARNQPILLVDPLGLGPYTDLFIESGLFLSCTAAGCYLGGPPGCAAGAFVGGGAALIYDAYVASDTAEEIADPIGESMQRYYDRSYDYPNSSQDPNASSSSSQAPQQAPPQ